MKESNFYSDEFEHLIREKTEQYKMYPSENVWKGVHNSLHTKRKWFIGSMAFLVTGILFFSGRELIAPSGRPAVKKSAAAGGSPTDGFGTDASRTNQPEDNSLTSFVRLRSSNAGAAVARHGSAAGNGGAGGQEEADQSYNHFSITISNPVVSQPDLSEFLSHAVHLPGQAPSLIAIQGTVAEPVAKASPEEHAGTGLLDSWLVRNATESPAVRKGIDAPTARSSADGLRVPAEGAMSRESADAAGSREAGHESESDDAAARDVLESLSAKSQQRAHGGVAGLARAKSARSQATVAGDAVRSADGGAADVSATAIEKAADYSRVNWLHDYAVYTLPPTPSRGRLFLQYVFTPTVNYRTLTGSDFNSVKDVTAPVTLTHPGSAQSWIDHSPAPGFEFGANLLYRVTRNLTVKGGLQFDFSRYKILAYASRPQQSTIPLNSPYGYYMDSLKAVSAAGNFAGQTQETLYNNYFQLSAPIGFELRVLGNERLQFNIGATVQPSYLLNANSYMLTSDYANYVKEPSLLRRWNISGGLEANLSYQTGPIRWQIGPEFRYQLLSTYNSPNLINENLKGYGLKIGITKALP